MPPKRYIATLQRWAKLVFESYQRNRSKKITGEYLKNNTENWRRYLSANGLCVIPKEDEEIEGEGGSASEAPLISGSSPPFVRAPIEDRSKYEKLTYNHDDVSSDDSDPNTRGGNLKGSLRQGKLSRRKKVTGKTKQAKGVRKKKGNNRGKTEGGGEVSGEVSDDSIGSASDLRAREEEEEEENEEKGERGETETINDSVQTCGSSAYHAETESMALEEYIMKCPKIPDIPEGLDMDALFVGHSYGDKPLLADDELDNEEDNPSSPPPLIDINDDVTPPPPPADVFALAPFHKPENKKRTKREANITPDALLQLSTPSPPLLVAISPVVEGPLVDLGDNDVENISESSFNSLRNNYTSLQQPFSVYMQENQTTVVTTTTSAPIATTTTVTTTTVTTTTSIISTTNTDTADQSKDLFGSSPFNNRHSNNPFTNGSEIISTNDGIFHRTSIVIGGNGETRVLTQSDDKSKTFDFHSNQSVNSVSNIFVSSPLSTFSNHDLFGSVPFDTVPSTVSNVQHQHLNNTQYFVQQPRTTLSTNTDNKVVNSMEQIRIVNRLPSEAGSESLPDCSSPEALILPSEIIDPNVKIKKEHKTHSLSDKCKYHYIEESRSVKNKCHKSSKAVKPSKNSKKVGKISTVGFSNMSFEDFPSDDADESLDQTSSVPFEVLRDEKMPVDGDRKFGSLKRRSNPFS